ncbi:MAG: hypothetical protein ACXWTT_07780 [Methylobacter sp.]
MTKNQIRLNHFDKKILALDASSMSIWNIVETFHELYGTASPQP